MTLDQLPMGKQAQVLRLREGDSMRERLQDLGVTPGARISVWMRSPLGDPTAFLISGAVIALRCEDAAIVEILTI